VAVTCVRYEVDGWGVGELWTSERRVVWHELPRAQAASPVSPASPISSPHPGWGSSPLDDPPPSKATLSKKPGRNGDDFATNVIARLEAFFAGEPVDFADVDLDLEELTGFQRACADALRRLPRGEVVTYGELAALAGRPGAARAAGTFCAQNKLSILIPCHRVVAAGGIGGYGSSGIDVKRRLLALENVTL
jgi:methylated-DNA-[protein]-cysteine S-methyltransferase